MSMRIVLPGSAGTDVHARLHDGVRGEVACFAEQRRSAPGLPHGGDQAERGRAGTSAAARGMEGNGERREVSTIEFKSADQALRWAFNTSARPMLKMSGIYNMRGAAPTTARELTPQENHAQAAQIGRWVDAMALLDRAYVHAMYARAVSEEEHAELLAYCRKALTQGVRADRGIVMLCSVYLGQRIGWRALRAELHCKNDEVPVLRNQIFGALELLHERVVEDYLYQRFGAVGLITGD